MEPWWLAALLLSLLGGAIGGALGLAGERLSETEDYGEVLAELPGANCGRCGLPSCREMAMAIGRGERTPYDCPNLGEEAARFLAGRLGLDRRSSTRVAVIRCQGKPGAPARYLGPADCRVAVRVAPGLSACPEGCLGLGSCAAACPFGAIRGGEEGVPVVDPDLCRGCGVCLSACPRGLIALVDRRSGPVLRCGGRLPAREMKACPAACLGCGACARACPTGALRMVEGRPVLTGDCPGCYDCVRACPRGCLLRGFEA